MVGVTLFNDVIMLSRPPEHEIRVVVAGAIAGAGLALLERAWPAGAVGFAWLGLLTVLLVRIDPKTPAPLETFTDWWNKAGKAVNG